MESLPPGSEPERRLGETVDDRYRLVTHLGTGGMASVYRAEHIRNGSTVAIKVLHQGLSANAEIAARFQREAMAARRIRHPNVVSAMDFGRLADGCSYIILEFVRGHDLCELLYREKPLAQPRAAKIALQVAEALVAAHGAGVVHRDLKPENIMLVERDGDPDFVKVVDFGIAKVATHLGPALTALGSVFGTPDYMAPEQARGVTVDHRSDLYTLGIVLYEMLNGQPPFVDEQVGQLILKQITQQPPPLPRHIDLELNGLVRRLLEKDPSRRYQSAEEVVRVLSGILQRLGRAPASVPSKRPTSERPGAASDKGRSAPPSATAPSSGAAAREASSLNVQKAIEHHRATLQHDPENVGSLEALKGLYRQAEAYGPLAELLKKQLDRLHPTDVRGRLWLLREIAQVFRSQLPRDPARTSILAEIVELSAKIQAEALLELRELAELCEGQARWRELLTYQSLLAERSPDVEEKKRLYRSMARRWLNTFSNLPNAIEAYSALLKLAPGDREAVQSLDELYAKRRASPPASVPSTGEPQKGLPWVKVGCALVVLAILVGIVLIGYLRIR